MRGKSCYDCCYSWPIEWLLSTYALCDCPGSAVKGHQRMVLHEKLGAPSTLQNFQHSSPQMKVNICALRYLQMGAAIKPN